METINGLLKSLDNKVPNSINKRLEGLQKLNEKLKNAKTEHEANPTVESKEALDEIIDFLNDTEEDIIEDLSTLVEQKRIADLKNKQEASERQASERQASEEKAKREASERRASEARAIERERAIQKRREKELQEKELQEKELEKKQLEKKESEEKELKSDEKTKTEKKDSIGWGSLLLGGVLLVVTGGAIKFFGNKK